MVSWDETREGARKRPLSEALELSVTPEARAQGEALGITFRDERSPREALAVIRAEAPAVAGLVGIFAAGVLGIGLVALHFA